MTESLSDWLALREPADVAARIRAGAALAAILPFLRARAAERGMLDVLDLAAGTGSNFRFLAGRLPDSQCWLFVDHDARLLAEALRRCAAWGAEHRFDVREDPTGVVLVAGSVRYEVATRCLDLGDPASLDVVAGRHLVTASALLDLVSEPWLQALAGQCRRERAGALFTLSYNGLSRCTPEEPEDDMVLALFNRHQGKDKGLGGPAAGPSAAACAARAFEGVGYEVERQQSDWHLLPEQQALQQQLIEGWAGASSEMDNSGRPSICAWLSRRLEHVGAGRSKLVVGHDDLAAWPAAS